jgi:hypothetical protein
MVDGCAPGHGAEYSAYRLHLRHLYFERVGMGDKAIVRVLEKTGIGWVAMPEPGTGEAGAGVDTFAAESFLRFLEECPVI